MGFFTDVLDSAGVSSSQEMGVKNNTQKGSVVSARIIDGLDSPNNRMIASDYDEVGSTAVGLASLSESSLLNPSPTAAESVQVAERDTVASVSPESHYGNELGKKNTVQDSFVSADIVSGDSSKDSAEDLSILSRERHTEVAGSEDNNATKNERGNKFAAVDIPNMPLEKSFRHHAQENPSVQTLDDINDGNIDHEDASQAIELDKASSLDSVQQALPSRAHLSNIPDRSLAEAIVDKVATDTEHFDASALELNASTHSVSEKISLKEEDNHLSSVAVQGEKEGSPKINQAELTLMHDVQHIESQRDNTEYKNSQGVEAERLRPKISIGHIDVIIVGGAPPIKENKTSGFKTSTYKRSYLGGV